MSKPSMLILGTGGIAQACLAKFGSTFNTTSVSRRTGDILGDLTEVSFRNRLVSETQPRVIITTYGVWPKNMSLVQALELYFNSVVDLFEKFENKGGLEYFVVVGSTDALFSCHPLISQGQLGYRTAKKSLSIFFQEVQKFGRYNSKIILIEPGMTATDFADINRRAADNKPEDIIHKLNLTMLNPADIANQISECLNSPRSLTITLHNRIGKST